MAVRNGVAAGPGHGIAAAGRRAAGRGRARLVIDAGLEDTLARTRAAGARLDVAMARCTSTLAAARQPARCLPRQRPAWSPAVTEVALRLMLSRAPDGTVERPAEVAPGIRLDPRRVSVILDGQEVNLTTTEWRLLTALVQSAGSALSRGDLAAASWGEGYRGRDSEVQVYVSRLRRKLGRHRRQALIETVRGLGYRLGSSPG